MSSFYSTSSIAQRQIIDRYMSSQRTELLCSTCISLSISLQKKWRLCRDHQKKCDTQRIFRRDQGPGGKGLGHLLCSDESHLSFLQTDTQPSVTQKHKHRYWSLIFLLDKAIKRTSRNNPQVSRNSICLPLPQITCRVVSCTLFSFGTFCILSRYIDSIRFGPSIHKFPDTLHLQPLIGQIREHGKPRFNSTCTFTYDNYFSLFDPWHHFRPSTLGRLFTTPLTNHREFGNNIINYKQKK